MNYTTVAEMRAENNPSKADVMIAGVINGMRGRRDMTSEISITYEREDLDRKAMFAEALASGKTNVDEVFPEERVREVFKTPVIDEVEARLKALGYSVRYWAYCVPHVGIIGCDMIVSAEADEQPGQSPPAPTPAALIPAGWDPPAFT